MRRLLVLAVLLSGCAHTPALRKTSDCDQVQGERRVECAACLVKNEADGWLGTFEYRPRERDGERCVRVK